MILPRIIWSAAGVLSLSLALMAAGCGAPVAMPPLGASQHAFVGATSVLAPVSALPTPERLPSVGALVPAAAVGTPATPTPAEHFLVTPLPPETPSAGAPPAKAPPAMPTLIPGMVPFPGNLLIADASNHRLIEVAPDKQIVWQYPPPGTQAPAGWFRYPDDAFFSPDGRYIAVSEETNQVIVVIDYQTQQIVWRYGVPGQPGRDLQHLNYPDDARILPDGRVAVADIRNCRILLISWDKQDVQSLGTPGNCSGQPGSFAEPNAVTPLANGHLLITEIHNRRVSEIDLQGNVVRAVQLPLYYPSDAFLTARDTLIVADYHTPGRVIEADWAGHVLWSFPPAGSSEWLNRTSIAAELPNGNIAICDDHRHRVIVVDRQGQIVWQYGVTGVPGSAPGYLTYPDGFDLHLPTAAQP